MSNNDNTLPDPADENAFAALLATVPTAELNSVRVRLASLLAFLGPSTASDRDHVIYCLRMIFGTNAEERVMIVSLADHFIGMNSRSIQRLVAYFRHQPHVVPRHVNQILENFSSLSSLTPRTGEINPNQNPQDMMESVASTRESANSDSAVHGRPHGAGDASTSGEQSQVVHRRRRRGVPSPDEEPHNDGMKEAEVTNEKDTNGDDKKNHASTMIVDAVEKREDDRGVPSPDEEPPILAESISGAPTSSLLNPQGESCYSKFAPVRVGSGDDAGNVSTSPSEASRVSPPFFGGERPNEIPNFVPEAMIMNENSSFPSRFIKNISSSDDSSHEDHTPGGGANHASNNGGTQNHAKSDSKSLAKENDEVVYNDGMKEAEVTNEKDTNGDDKKNHASTMIVDAAEKCEDDPTSNDEAETTNAGTNEDKKNGSPTKQTAVNCCDKCSLM